MADRPAAYIGLGHLVHFDRGHNTCGNALRFKRVLQRQGIDDGGQHAHMIAGYAIHILGGRGHATEEIASADHQADLDASPRHFGHFSRHGVDLIRIDTKSSGAGEHLAT